MAARFLGLLAALGLGTSACVLVMDSDFEKYQAASTMDHDASDGAGGSFDAEADRWEDAEAGSGGTVTTGGAGGGDTGGTGGNGGSGGNGGTGGLGGIGGLGGSGGTGGAAASCDDGIQNQGETDVDCGGPCPPCSVGFLHTENFDSFPNWGPDGAYVVTGPCHEDKLVEGWGISNEQDPFFSLASGYYAAIFSDKLLYAGLPCDDSMISPLLNTNGATQITLSFDSSFLRIVDSTASVWLVRDGINEKLWSRTTSNSDQHVELGPFPTNGASKVRVLFRYQAELELYWKVDNIVIEGT